MRLMRLRATARLSALRETAMPSRASVAPGRSRAIRRNCGLDSRLPSLKAAWYSAAARRRARGGKVRETSGACGAKAGSGARAAVTGGAGDDGSDGEPGAALGTATGQDLAAVGGLHAGAEAVVALALEVAGLVRALGGHGGTPVGRKVDEMGGKDPGL